MRPINSCSRCDLRSFNPRDENDRPDRSKYRTANFLHSGHSASPAAYWTMINYFP
jgi:hypothetical protein